MNAEEPGSAPANEPPESSDLGSTVPPIIGSQTNADDRHGRSEPYSPEEQMLLLKLARQAITELVTSRRVSEVGPSGIPSRLLEERACFVTLFKDGQLRGCIGHLTPRYPLYYAVMESARSAATQDPRFPSMAPDELERISIELSILTESVPLRGASPEELLAQLEAEKHGVTLRLQGRMGTFLPQVWEQFPSKLEFMEKLSRKAGCSPSAWRSPDAEVFVYEAWKIKEQSAGEPAA